MINNQCHWIQKTCNHGLEYKGDTDKGDTDKGDTENESMVIDQ